jgi:hypothetical protein
MISRKTRNDIILIAAVVLIAAIALMALILANDEGATAVVYVEGKLFGKYPLDTDRVVEIITQNGTNTLIIKDGKADMIRASCPDLKCVDHAPISKDIDQIICLPNKVVVTVE